MKMKKFLVIVLAVLFGIISIDVRSIKIPYNKFIEFDVEKNFLDFFKEKASVEPNDVKTKADVADANYILGLCYEKGLGGVELDPNSAINNYKKAADLGHVMAQYKLGMHYKNGDNCAINNNYLKNYKKCEKDRLSKLFEIDDKCNQNIVKGELKVIFFDVGSADCILVQQNGKNMLIDAGRKSIVIDSKRKDLIKYLKDQKIKEFEYVVATHPHGDHVKGMSDIIGEFKVNNVLVPLVQHKTKAFKYLENSVKKNVVNNNKKNFENLFITVPNIGDEFDLGDAKVIVMSLDMQPNSNPLSKEQNAASIVLKVCFGKNSFLFTGDADVEMEKNMIEMFGDRLKADVLKIGHHGSGSSTSIDFLNAVNPSKVVISVGNDDKTINKYHLPNKGVIDMLDRKIINVNLEKNVENKKDAENKNELNNEKKMENEKLKIYRTDADNSIIMISDGNTIYPPGDDKINTNKYSAEGNIQIKNTNESSKEEKASTKKSSKNNEKEDRKQNNKLNGNMKTTQQQSVQDNQVVYIKQKGKVYHKSKKCGHIDSNYLECSMTVAKAKKCEPCGRCKPDIVQQNAA